MPRLRKCNSLVSVFDRQLHRLSAITGSLPPTPKMKIGKAPELLKKAVTMCKSKTGVLAARLLILASLRRRMAVAAAISHRIHALVAADREKARVDCHKALMPRQVEKPAIHGGEIVDLSAQLALFDQEEQVGYGCHDWTLHPLFNDDNNFCYTDEYDDDGDDDDHAVLLDALDEDDDVHDDDEPSVMDMIRSSREEEGLVFNMDDEIDQAADMFIRRFRKRMNSFQ